MDRISSYEQYSHILKEFKKDRARCSANKLFTRDELSVFIEGNKLWYEKTDDTLWFFSDEGEYYSAYFYVSAGVAISMSPQDKDVLVELMGNQKRYNEQWEKELLAAGFVKYARYLERIGQFDDVIENVNKRLSSWRTVFGAGGLFCRKATIADWPDISELWRTKLDKYIFVNMTEKELEEMMRDGRCLVISDKDDHICAMHIHLTKKNTAIGYILATNIIGLGAWVNYEYYAKAYEEGYRKHTSWVNENNREIINMGKRDNIFSGKFFWQFVYKQDN